MDNFRLINFLILIAVTSAKNLRTQWDQSHVEAVVGAGSDPGAQLVGFIVGPILFFCSFAFIWVNQKKAAIDEQRMRQAKQTIQQASNQDQKIKQQLNSNGLRYASGKPLIINEAVDQQFNIRIENAIRIQRIVEVQEFRDFGNQANLMWVTINQPEVLGKKNSTDNWFINKKVSIAPKVTLGGFYLNQNQKLSSSCNQFYKMEAELADKFIKKMKKNHLSFKIIDDYTYFYQANEPGQQAHNSHGSVRVKFEYYQTSSLSIIAGLDDNDTFQPYEIENNDKVCCEGRAFCFLCSLIGTCMKPISQIDILNEGSYSSSQLFQMQLSINSKMRYLFRLLGFIIMALGVYLLFLPLTTVLGYIPFFGSYLAEIQSYVFLGAVLTTLPLYFLTISLAWLIHSPKKGIIFLAVGIALIIAWIVLGTVL